MSGREALSQTLVIFVSSFFAFLYVHVVTFVLFLSNSVAGKIRTGFGPVCESVSAYQHQAKSEKARLLDES